MFIARFTATPAVAEPVAAVPAAMITPARAGPMTRAELKAIELRAIALARRCLGTRSAANACRAGISTALTSPNHSAMTITIGISTTPVAVRTNRTRACPAAAVWLKMSTRRLSTRSAKTPEGRQHHGRTELEDRNEAELDRRSAQRQDQPRQADLLHPGPHEAHDLAAPVESVVAYAKGLEPASQRAGGSTGGRGLAVGRFDGSREAHASTPWGSLPMLTTTLPSVTPRRWPRSPPAWRRAPQGRGLGRCGGATTPGPAPRRPARPRG